MPNLNLTANLGLNSKGFHNGMKQAKKEVKTFQSDIKDVAKTIGLMWLAQKAGQTIMRELERSFDNIVRKAEDMKKMSDELGISADESLRLSHAAKLAKVQVNELAAAYKNIESAKRDKGKSMMLAMSGINPNQTAEQIFSQINSKALQSGGKNAAFNGMVEDVIGGTPGFRNKLYQMNFDDLKSRYNMGGAADLEKLLDQKAELELLRSSIEAGLTPIVIKIYDLLNKTLGKFLVAGEYVKGNQAYYGEPTRRGIMLVSPQIRALQFLKSIVTGDKEGLKESADINPWKIVTSGLGGLNADLGPLKKRAAEGNLMIPRSLQQGESGAQLLQRRLNWFLGRGIKKSDVSPFGIEDTGSRGMSMFTPNNAADNLAKVGGITAGINVTQEDISRRALTHLASIDTSAAAMKFLQMMFNMGSAKVTIIQKEN